MTKKSVKMGTNQKKTEIHIYLQFLAIYKMIVQYSNNTGKYKPNPKPPNTDYIWQTYGSECLNYASPRSTLNFKKHHKSKGNSSKLFDMNKKTGTTIRRYKSEIEQDPNKYIFLNKYRILPNKEKPSQRAAHKFPAFGEECKSTQKIKYKKIQKYPTHPSHSKNKHENNTDRENRRINKLDNGTSAFSYANQNQRSAYELENGTKFTLESFSTGTATQPYIHHRQIMEDPYFFAKEKSRQMSRFSKIKASSQMSKKAPIKKVMIQEAYQNMIPEEYESSQSKTNRNLSILSINTKSGKSLKSFKSGKSSIKNKSMKSSFKSHKSSLKNSIFLPINSISIRHSKANPEEMSNVQQLEGFAIIQNYMELLNILASYAHQITQNYQNTEDWQQLIFLTYKKYYLARMKFFNALMYRNTLFFEYEGVKIPSSAKKSLKSFMNSTNGELLRKQIFKQNSQILDSLRNIYNLAIEKSGNYINMEQNDNFSCQIYRLIVEQIEQLKENYYRQPEMVKTRLKSVVRCVTTIAKLDKKFEEEKYVNEQIQKPMTIQIFQNIVNLIRQRLI